MIKLFSILLFLSVFLGCTTIHQELDPKIYYKRDMSIKFNKQKYEGIAVLPFMEKPSYDIEFETKGKLDLFTFTTCHREITQEHASTRGIFANKKQFSLIYSPDIEIEALFSCPIQIAGYDLKGKHSFAFMDMETKDATLPAHIKCNGDSYDSKGVTICQSKDGLEQSVYFDVKIEWMPEKSIRKECQEIEYNIINEQRIFYKTPNRECVYYIHEKDGNRTHRLNTIGYEELLIREL
jgi:hypothetical protein